MRVLSAPFGPSFRPFAKAAGTGQGADRAELHYAVKPTAAQVAASNNGFKLVVVFFLPVVPLVFLNPEDIQRPRLRVAAMYGGIGLQSSCPMTVPFRVGLFHWCFQPHLQSPQYAAIADPTGHRFHQIRMGNYINLSS
jgi:hypothetical protein